MIAAIYARKSNARKSTEQDVSDDAIARPEPRPVAPLGESEIFYFGRMMRSARSRRLPRDLDRLAAEHQPRGLEQDFVLRRPDLSLDDLDRQVFPLAAREPGGAVPHRRSRARGDSWRAHHEHSASCRVNVPRKIRRASAPASAPRCCRCSSRSATASRTRPESTRSSRGRTRRPAGKRANVRVKSSRVRCHRWFAS